MFLSAEAEATQADIYIFGLPVELGTFLLQLVIFILLLFLLRRYALKPLLTMMQKRQEHIEHQLKEAEQHRMEAEKLLRDQEAALEASRKEAAEILQRAKTMSDKEAAKLLEEARNEAARLREQALSEIARERENAIASLREEVARLSVAIAGRLIEKELDEKANRNLIDQYMKQVGGLQ
ncbi:ATP synthase subunit b [[Clostridium] ultunense Esp]|nr:ATP synthase subunit b [[Clostridium] ultunense Esp]